VANSANRGKNSGIKYRLSTLMDYRNTEGYKNDAGFTRKMTKANDYEVKRARTEEEKAKKLQEVQRKKAFAKTPFGKLSSAWSISGFLSDDSFAHRQAWLTTEQADNEAAQFAFFVDERGLILGNAWQSAQQTFEMLMSPKTDVVWQTWISALAGVWADESERQRVLMECADIDASVPQLVQDMRDAKLAGI
jgi:hypothetical protein